MSVQGTVAQAGIEKLLTTAATLQERAAQAQVEIEKMLAAAVALPVRVVEIVDYPSLLEILKRGPITVAGDPATYEKCKRVGTELNRRNIRLKIQQHKVMGERFAITLSIVDAPIKRRNTK